LSRYRFRHHLFQRYLYQRLDALERARLHEEVGDTLEALYGGRPAAEGAGTVLLLDAGGTAVGLLAERVLRVGEEAGRGAVRRPAWDALFAS
jgi:hypothetical protein